jgi:hypothetical protein
MSTEFEKVGPNNAKSARGFGVVWRPLGGVEYTDANGTIEVVSELLEKPLRLLVYRGSAALRTMPDNQAEEIVGNIVRALEYLGHQVEIHNPDPRTHWS